MSMTIIMFENDISWPVLSTKSNCMEEYMTHYYFKLWFECMVLVGQRVVNAHHNPINYVAKDDPSNGKDCM